MFFQNSNMRLYQVTWVQDSQVVPVFVSNFPDDKQGLSLSVLSSVSFFSGDVLEQRRQVGVAAAEEALEATESSNTTPVEEGQSGIYTEHVFTDPLGVQSSRNTPSSYTQRCFHCLECSDVWKPCIDVLLIYYLIYTLCAAHEKLSKCLALKLS